MSEETRIEAPELHRALLRAVDEARERCSRALAGGRTNGHGRSQS